MIWIHEEFGLLNITTWLLYNGFLILHSNCSTLRIDNLKYYSNMAHCINCNIIIPANQQYIYNAVSMSPDIITIIEEWIAHEVTVEDRICQECINLLLVELNNRNEGNIGGQQFGHEAVCISCGISIHRRSGRRSRPLLEGHPERAQIMANINSHQVPANARACNACWQRAHHQVQQLVAQPQVQQLVAQPQVQQLVAQPQVQQLVAQPSAQDTERGSSPLYGSIHAPSSEPVSDPSSELDIDRPNQIEQRNINLDGYQRTPDTSNHCFVPECTNSRRLRVPEFIKKTILINQKLYVTPNARVCEEHIAVYNWEFLNDFVFTTDFNVNHIKEMLDLLRKETTQNIDFENAENMNNHVLKYWTGLTILNFLSLLNSINEIAGVWCKKPKLALGLYLMRLRTGEPFRRIASLVCLSKTLTCFYTKKARNCMTQYYVPLHVGINHITRESLSSKNLIIPQGLFGTAENNPIVICDGTYVYLQKSSNYLFQKKSYSLHKFQNLVKPFLIVATDGYIVDIFGPYAATTSDATIMKQLFANENAPLREYFRPNDVFLLDRGFRDAIDLLNSVGFNVYKPETLGEGETQLTTIKANKSRLVTLCRWVVEVVNGRFKRDWKIFRNKYFNIGSRNLIDDFKVAGALINHFHPVLTDRPDAQLILERASQRMDLPNYLAEHVIGHQLNRRRANFIQINAEIPHLDMFPIMDMSDLILFSLGIYQIKQARSYYGEHIRENGTFIIEVSNDISIVNVPGILSSQETVLIRGRIKSRHQSNKVYFTYILLKNILTSWQDQICGYYCSCIIGKRTVGSCAHVMTIVWYLGWARHQNEIISPPAQFLDSILVREDIENEV